jgi:DNA repair exonuclease SbcCD ATPase subunit
MRLKHLHIENYLGFREVDLEFPVGPAFILGENRDQSSQGSNGSGKTALIQAITWCLFDVVRPGWKKDEIIHHGQDYALVRVELEHDDQEIVVERTRKHPDHKDGARLWVDGEPQTKDKEDSTIRAIEQHIGITKKAFFKTVLADNPVINPPFVSLTPAPMLSVVTELLELERFDSYSKRAKDMAKREKVENEKLLIKLSHALDSKEETQAKIDELTAEIETFELQKDADLQVAKERGDKLSVDIAKLALQIEEYAEAEAAFNSFDMAQVKAVATVRGQCEDQQLLIDSLVTAVNEAVTKMGVEEQRVQTVRDKIANLSGEHAECGYCGSSLEGSKSVNAKLVEFEAELQAQSDKLIKLQATHLKSQAEMDKATTQLLRLKKRLSECEAVKEEYDELKEKMGALNSLQHERQLLDAKLIANDKAIDSIKDRSVAVLQRQLDGYLESLEGATDSQSDLQQQVKKSDTTIEALDLLVKCFKQVKHGVMNGFIARLLQQINYNLDQFTEGDFVASLNMGRDGLLLTFSNSKTRGFAQYATFSRGEQVRIAKAVQIALAQVSGATILIEDEGFSGLDPAGVVPLIDFMLESGMVNLLFVSHATVVSDYLRDFPTIKVTKENDVATVEVL